MKIRAEVYESGELIDTEHFDNRDAASKNVVQTAARDYADKVLEWINGAPLVAPLTIQDGAGYDVWIATEN